MPDFHVVKTTSGSVKSMTVEKIDDKSQKNKALGRILKFPCFISQKMKRGDSSATWP